MNNEQKALARARREQKKIARIAEKLVERGASEEQKREMGRWKDLENAAVCMWEKAIFSAAALVQEAHAADCEAVLADDPAVSARAVAAGKAAEKGVAYVWAMLMPTVRESRIVPLEDRGKVEDSLRHAWDLLIGFPGNLVERIPSWGGAGVDRYRQRPFRINPARPVASGCLSEDGEGEEKIEGVKKWPEQAAADLWVARSGGVGLPLSVKQEMEGLAMEAPELQALRAVFEAWIEGTGRAPTEEECAAAEEAWGEALAAAEEAADAVSSIESEQRLPSDPAELRELAALFRWQKGVFRAAVDVLAGRVAEYLEAAERKRVGGPLPVEGLAAASGPLIAAAGVAKERVRNELGVFEESDSKKKRHAAMKLLAGEFPRQLVPPLPSWRMVRDSRVRFKEPEQLEGVERAAYDLAAAAFFGDFDAATLWLVRE